MLLSGHYNIIEKCTFRENRDSGLQLSRYNTSYNTKDKWPSNNLIIDCLSTMNMDSRREDADVLRQNLPAEKVTYLELYSH